MSWFTSLQVTYQLAVVLAGLIVLTFIAGFIKVYLNRRKIKYYTAKEDLEAQEKASRPIIQVEELGEGDYFGVRAIEKGFFGGVAQSNPTTPIGSPRLSPTSTLFDSPTSPAHDPSSSTTSLPNFPQLQLSRTVSHGAQKKKPGPLRPVQFEKLNVKAYTPKSPVGDEPEGKGKEKDIVDVRETYQPAGSSVQPEMGIPAHAYLTVDNPARSIKSQRGSLHSNSSSMRSPTLSGAPLAVTAARNRQRERLDPKSKEKLTLPQSPPAVQLRLSGVSSWSEAILENMDSNNRKRISIVDYYQPSRGDTAAAAERQSPQKDQDQLPVLTQTKTEPQNPFASSSSSSGHSPSNSQDSSVSSNASDSSPEHRRTINISHRHKSSNDLNKAIKRSNDSLRLSHRFSVPKSPRTVAAKRRSLDRDHMHYDPRNQSRNRAGSVQGRKVDFDNPRASPFNHQPSLSDSSQSDSSIKGKTNNLKVKPAGKRNRSRTRSGSETSNMSNNTSIGEFYDTYYSSSQPALPTDMQQAIYSANAMPPSAELIARALSAAAATSPEYNPSTATFYYAPKQSAGVKGNEDENPFRDGPTSRRVPAIRLDNIGS